MRTKNNDPLNINYHIFFKNDHTFQIKVYIYIKPSIKKV